MTNSSYFLKSEVKELVLTMPIVKMNYFLRYALFHYKCVGIKPYENRSLGGSSSIGLQFIYWANVINLCLTLLGEVFYVLVAMATGEHILEAIMVMSYIGFVVVGMSKMVFVWLNKKALNQIIWDLEDLFPRGKQKQAAYRVDYYLKSCSRISLAFSLLYTLLIWTYNLFNLMQYVIYELWLKTRVIPETLPYQMYIPWHSFEKWTYYLLLFNQIFAGYTSAAGQVSTDLLLYAVAMLIIMHFDYLAHLIDKYPISGDWQQDSRSLTEIVYYHERLLRIFEQLNTIFGMPLILNFMISSFVLCFVSFQMTFGVKPDELVKLLLFLVSSLAQVYLMCHHGQLIADVSTNISLAAYGQDWTITDVRYRRALLLIIMRSQKTTYLKATVLMQINRGTMTVLLQLSYKFFALLRTIYVK